MGYVMIWGENVGLSTLTKNYTLTPKESFTSKNWSHKNTVKSLNEIIKNINLV